jgi:hypothetical protein
MSKQIPHDLHLNIEEVLQAFENLNYPANKIIAKVNVDDFLDTEIYNEKSLFAAINKALNNNENETEHSLIILKVESKSKTFSNSSNGGENNHYVGLYFSRNEHENLEITYIDPTGQEISPAMKKMIKDSNYLPQNFTIKNSEISLQYTNSSYTPQGLYIMGGNDTDCGVLLPLIATLLKEGKGEEYKNIKLNFEESKTLGQILRNEINVEKRQEIDEILNAGKNPSHENSQNSELDRDFNKLSTINQDPQTSDESPDSSDEEYGAKTIMRKVFSRVEKIPDDYYKDKPSDKIITEDEIKNNPKKYYVANFRGDRLDYFSDNISRRKSVKEKVDGTLVGKNISYKSIAAQNISKVHDEGSKEYSEKLSAIKGGEKLSSAAFVKLYKSPSHFPKAVSKISPTYGNPMISSSKSPDVTTAYADHAKSNAKVHPKYNKGKKPKHRLIGMQSVFVHEAGEYIERKKADIEKLRHENAVGKKAAVERENKEIIFSDEIASDNVAGYVPLTYPNLSKDYSADDKKLFGIGEKKPNPGRKTPASLSDDVKKSTIYSISRRLQWRLAEQYVKERNPEGKLLWVDEQGKFHEFSKELQNVKKLDFGDEKKDEKNNSAIKPVNAKNLSSERNNKSKE